ncbi:cyclase, partial [bacterium]
MSKQGDMSHEGFGGRRHLRAGGDDFEDLGDEELYENEDDFEDYEEEDLEEEEEFEEEEEEEEE